MKGFTLNQMLCWTCLLITTVYCNVLNIEDTQSSESNATAGVELSVPQQSQCDKSENPGICSSGSRMYKLLSYDVDHAHILSECYSACNDSYSSEQDVGICNGGCLAEVERFNRKKSEMMDFESVLHQARMQQMLSHWMFEMVAGFDMFNDWYDGSSGSRAQPDEEYSTYVVVEQSNNQLRISSYRVVERPQLHSTTSNSPSGGDSGPLNPYAESKDEDFEPCLMRTSYSRWVLCLLLFSSGLFLIWLTCSTVSTAPRQRVRSTEEAEMRCVGDEKLSLKMMLAYPPTGPAPVHTYNTSADDVKMITA